MNPTRLPEMPRRTFMALVSGGLLAMPLAAEAQTAGRIWRIGYLGPAVAAANRSEVAFRQGLRDLGYVEGGNLVIEYRSAEGKVERLPALAAELVALKVDVIVAPTTPAALAAKQATRPAWRGRAAMSRGCPASARTWSASVWNCSHRPLRGSAGSLSSASQVAPADARTRT